MLQTGEQLLRRVQAGDGPEVANLLLKQFFAGYPVDNLRRLLESGNEGAVRAGAWIASELGTQVCPLISTITPLLNHPSRYVRFLALDPVLVCAGPEGGPLVATAMKLLRDSDPAVRWKALNFLAKAKTDQLRSSIAPQSDEELASLTNWLVSLDSESNSGSKIIKALDATEQLERAFAAAAAARSAKRDVLSLQRASLSSDNDVRSFAEEQLRLLQ